MRNLNICQYREIESELMRKFNFNLFNSEKKDSQEICFLGDQNENHLSFMLERGTTSEPGYFLDSKGSIIGTHLGLIHYTVGQRKGLGQTFGKPMYVLSLDWDKNTVTLGEDQELYRPSAISKNHIILGNTASVQILKDLVGLKVDVKIRSTGDWAPAVIAEAGNDWLRTEFLTPQRAVTPGQSIVFYEGDRLLGGGIIET